MEFSFIYMILELWEFEGPAQYLYISYECALLDREILDVRDIGCCGIQLSYSSSSLALPLVFTVFCSFFLMFLSLIQEQQQSAQVNERT